jgi:hypothetical protein
MTTSSEVTLATCRRAELTRIAQSRFLAGGLRVSRRAHPQADARRVFQHHQAAAAKHGSHYHPLGAALSRLAVNWRRCWESARALCIESGKKSASNPTAWSVNWPATIPSSNKFERKAADILGLYLNPPQHAAVFCVDEKTAIQALGTGSRAAVLAVTSWSFHSGSSKIQHQFGFFADAVGFRTDHRLWQVWRSRIKRN